ncbi:hypothetical protein [Lentibacillus kapialis]
MAVKLPASISDSAVATVGRQIVEPNGVNVILGQVTLYVDIRDFHIETRDQLVEETIQVAAICRKASNSGTAQQIADTGLFSTPGIN